MKGKVGGPGIPKETVLHAEKYHKRTAKIREDYLPRLLHTSWKVEEAYVEEAGKVKRGDQVLEYQVIRVYLKEM